MIVKKAEDDIYLILNDAFTKITEKPPETTM